ncbi:DNA-dependent ATPase and ssDNA annealing protein [Komagataella phaffii CBS 7435]|uniref:DNA-dependent ATPase and ssDNA annealing protein n=1 Tax=Komagataella phaffii (strain ATCC 76273 / CBS 7435 / CECT 11047 / NRRL Y-11430 / Wegner 21-1) TaxID=981350 RepID=F2QRG7_KOMPC|nr:GQ67_01042T0 [Komagataella phaffii]AOA67631.1 GQ68_00347T0 [Komagataella phaffii GS115]CAH2447825.1 DNA-dependent ATPase and ssDNA annealing protein [Komagataella phaffii CBS 7435]CCA37995.2 DNA-dependent ATPase and ssDNA annealing protein [Komagataella phaffii CBS 7435]
MVRCPICSKSMDIGAINAHLDQCMAQKEPKKPVSAKSVLSHGKFKGEGITSPSQKTVVEIPSEQDNYDLTTNLSSSPTQNSSVPSTEPATKKQKLNEATDIKKLRMSAKLPLAERLRPKTLEEYVGQSHLVGPTGVLRGFIEHDRVPSMILWGPPGVGKTSLARIIAASTHNRCVELSATSSGISECRKVFEEARNEMRLTKRRTVLFCDEIHRFNKSQQDAFLPYVERGDIILIGATTENPSFQLNSALLSRCRVFVLNKLDNEDLAKVVNRSLLLVNRVRKLVYNMPVLRLTTESLQYIIGVAGGDSRTALNLVEMVDSHYQKNDDTTAASVEVDPSTLREVLRSTHAVYDRVGDQHYDAISAFHKSVRGSNVDATLYYLARMLHGGEDPLYISRRMIRMASEDIGVVDDSCLPFAVATFDAVHKVGLPEADVMLAHCAYKLATAAKSVSIYRAWNKVKAKVAQDANFAGAPIPMHLRNAPTKLMEELGYSKGYKYNPDFKEGKVVQEYLPSEIKDETFYEDRHLGDVVDSDLEANGNS